MVFLDTTNFNLVLFNYQFIYLLIYLNLLVTIIFLLELVTYFFFNAGNVNYTQS